MKTTTTTLLIAEIYGCTAPDAQNYMEEATMDDGSCTLGVIIMEVVEAHPLQIANGQWEDNSFMDNENFLVIRANFGDDSCPHEMEGRFTVELHQRQ